MPRTSNPNAPPAARHVSLLAVPDAGFATLAGIYDVMNAHSLMGLSNTPARSPFQVEIVGEAVGPLDIASGLPVPVQRAVDSIETTDIVIVPSLLVRGPGWQAGRYPRLVDWLQRMHERGAVLCSACSGIFLLAETGLFDGKDATVHFAYARQFSAVHPAVTIHPERVLVISGQREDLVSSGASTTWHWCCRTSDSPQQGRSTTRCQPATEPTAIRATHSWSTEHWPRCGWRRGSG